VRAGQERAAGDQLVGRGLFEQRGRRLPPAAGGGQQLVERHLRHGAYLVSERHRTDPDLRQAPIIVRVPGRTGGKPAGLEPPRALV
jgi:hypothetical protein